MKGTYKKTVCSINHLSRFICRIFEVSTFKIAGAMAKILQELQKRRLFTFRGGLGVGKPNWIFQKSLFSTVISQDLYLVKPESFSNTTIEPKGATTSFNKMEPLCTLPRWHRHGWQTICPTFGGRMCGRPTVQTAVPSTSRCGGQRKNHKQVPQQHCGDPEDGHCWRICCHAKSWNDVRRLLLTIEDRGCHRG